MRQPDARSAKDVHGRCGHVILMDVDHTVFRLPLHKRVLTVIGVAVFAIGCIAAACASHAPAGGIVTVSVFMALAVAMGYLMFGVSVTVQGEELVVRNYWTTRHIPRGYIRGFDRGRPSMGQGRTIVVDTGMSTVPLDALVVWPDLHSSDDQRQVALSYLSSWAGVG